MEDFPRNLNFIPCPSCQEENEIQNQFCVRSGCPLQKEKKTNCNKRYLLFGVVIFAFLFGIFFFLRESFESKIVGKVNGEDISRKEFSKRVERIKKLYELRYGKGFFSGKTGEKNLNRLKNDIFEEMVAEKILLQEAKNAGYTSTPKEEVEKQLKIIKEKYGLSEKDFREKMGISIDDLEEELRKEWIISNFIEKAIFKGDFKNGEAIFAKWFANAKANAKIEAYEKFEPFYSVKASCCRTGCGGGIAQPLDPEIERDAKAKALEYYEKKTQKKVEELKVTNFGCHIQVDIIENGKVVISLTYNGKDVQEI